MMRKLTAFMHVSLDGIVAGPHGEMDWIHVDEEIFDYVGNRTNNANTALYGRNTYEIMESYWPTAADKPDASRHDKQHSAWYMNVDKIVLSGTLQSDPAKKRRVIQNNLEQEIHKLKAEPGNEIIIFGSPGAIHSLSEFDLIDAWWLFINPVLVGEGKPLFRNITSKRKLRLSSQHAFSSGVVCLSYERT